MEEAKKKISGPEAVLAAFASVGTTSASRTVGVIERARFRLEAHDALRAELVAELEAGQARVARLKAMAEKPGIPDQFPSWPFFRANIASVEEERDAVLQARPVKKAATGCGVTGTIPAQELPAKKRVPCVLDCGCSSVTRNCGKPWNFGENTMVLE